MTGEGSGKTGGKAGGTGGEAGVLSGEAIRRIAFQLREKRRIDFGN